MKKFLYLLLAASWMFVASTVQAEAPKTIAHDCIVVGKLSAVSPVVSVAITASPVACVLHVSTLHPDMAYVATSTHQDVKAIYSTTSKDAEAATSPRRPPVYWTWQRLYTYTPVQERQCLSAAITVAGPPPSSNL